jgi:8-oxo-dGTP pyrophosphatase MutT (NUDIX family)
MMQYVLVYPYCPVFNGPDIVDVMLIRKAKPAWQKGRLNLVGGKVEPGESFDQAAEREFGEETGLSSYGYRRAGTIRSDRSDFVIGVYTCNTEWKEIQSEPGEPVAWYDWADVKDDPALMENLKTVIPLLQADMRGWTLLHSRNDAGQECCSIEWEDAHVTA